MFRLSLWEDVTASMTLYGEALKIVQGGPANVTDKKKNDPESMQERKQIFHSESDLAVCGLSMDTVWTLQTLPPSKGLTEDQCTKQNSIYSHMWLNIRRK